MRKLWAAIAAATLVGACASTSDGITVTLDEYTLEAGAATAPAGRIAFAARNVGKIEHELAVIKTDRGPDDLPVKDGEVQTDTQGLDLVAGTGRIKAGASQALEVTLRPGSYVLLCNIPAHYQTGMRAPFRVS